MRALSQPPLLSACQVSFKSDNPQGKRDSEEKSGQTKKQKLHEMLDLLCFQSQNLESRRAYDVEILRVFIHPPLLYAYQVSSKSENFQGKKASNEKSGQAKKQQFHVMLDMLCFQSQKPD